MEFETINENFKTASLLNECVIEFEQKKSACYTCMTRYRRFSVFMMSRFSTSYFFY